MLRKTAAAASRSETDTEVTEGTVSTRRN